MQETVSVYHEVITSFNISIFYMYYLIADKFLET